MSKQTPIATNIKPLASFRYLWLILVLAILAKATPTEFAKAYPRVPQSMVRTGFPVIRAQDIVISCVLSPSSASKTAKNTESKPTPTSIFSLPLLTRNHAPIAINKAAVIHLIKEPIKLLITHAAKTGTTLATKKAPVETKSTVINLRVLAASIAVDNIVLSPNSARNTNPATLTASVRPAS